MPSLVFQEKIQSYLPFQLIIMRRAMRQALEVHRTEDIVHCLAVLRPFTIEANS